jgi:hypothetical protein
MENKPPKDLTNLLRPDIKHDIYAIGTEECLKTIFKSAFGASKIRWVESIKKCLGPEYRVITSHSLMGIHLVVLASIRVIPLITNIQSNHVTTGILNTIGNKGGIGITFKVGDTSLIFINCHLASGEEEMQDNRRTRDFINIDKRMKLPFKYSIVTHKDKENTDLTRVSNRFD